MLVNSTLLTFSICALSGFNFITLVRIGIKYCLHKSSFTLALSSYFFGGSGRVAFQTLFVNRVTIFAILVTFSFYTLVLAIVLREMGRTSAVIPGFSGRIGRLTTRTFTSKIVTVYTGSFASNAFGNVQRINVFIRITLSEDNFECIHVIVAYEIGHESSFIEVEMSIFAVFF